ncbi:polymorphic toxin type 34 domain-containing protein [Microseira sp. BLCC-F43]|uniref:polymorphic toxin type 34 domain-containing protein n=1 Tax=Microseira sp. BLCC-F43 TaxID=3153602 RepID=UPI0035B943E8
MYFGAGKAPGNNELMAHELTHVVQQTGASKQTAQMKTEVIQRFAPAAAAPAAVFGPVGLTVAVGVVGVTIVVLWLNNGGWEEIGRITDAIGKGINGSLEELRNILNKAGNAARERLEEIEEYIRIVMMAAPGNQADTGIMQEANELVSQGQAGDICEALALLMKQAKSAQDTNRIGRIKATQKAKGCRHSRHS